MKKILIAMVLFIKAYTIHAQTADSGTIADIRKLEQEEYSAMLHQDITELQKIWASDFMVNAPFNRVTLGSGEVIDLVKKGVIRYSSFTRDIEQIMVKKNFVITMGRETVVPMSNANDNGLTVKRRFTNIWSHQTGSWRLIARHANVICQ